MSILLIVAALLVLGLGVSWYMRSHASSSSPDKPADGKKQASEQMTPDQNALLELALHPGEDGIPLMFALETCRHCRKAREFLDDNKVTYHLVYVDQYSGEVRSQLMDKVRTFNPRGSFPTFVMPGGKTVVGFREQLLREALHHESGRTD